MRYECDMGAIWALYACGTCVVCVGYVWDTPYHRCDTEVRKVSRCDIVAIFIAHFLPSVFIRGNGRNEFPTPARCSPTFVHLLFPTARRVDSYCGHTGSGMARHGFVCWCRKNGRIKNRHRYGLANSVYTTGFDFHGQRTRIAQTRECRVVWKAPKLSSLGCNGRIENPHRYDLGPTVDSLCSKNSRPEAAYCAQTACSTTRQKFHTGI